MTRCDLIVAGVGGQGILAIATTIAEAGLAAGLRVKQSEVHGMAQRGGAVQAHVRLSSETVWSDLIPKGAADLILSMEPMEALRYVPWLQPDGWLVANETPVQNMAAYPDLHAVRSAIGAWPRHVLFDASAVARKGGLPKAANMAVLGAAAPFLPLPAAVLEAGIRRRFACKGAAVAEANVMVFQAARTLAESIRRPASVGATHADR